MNRYYFGHDVGVVLVGPPSLGNTWKIRRHKPKSFKGFVVQSELFRTEKLYMPNPSTFTARIADIEEFEEEKTKTSKIVMGKVEAEGTIVPINCAFTISTADCYTVVLSHKESRFLLAFHAGFRSLVDFELALTCSPSRKHFSVIDSAMSVVRKKDIPPEELHISLHCGIQKEHYAYPYNHPEFGGTNKALLRYLRKTLGTSVSPTLSEGGEKIHHKGYVDLKEIITLQLEHHGVNTSLQIFDDEIDPAHPDNEFVSVHQGTAQRIKKVRKERRNLVMVWCLESNWSASVKSEYT